MPEVRRYAGDPDPEPREPEDTHFVRADPSCLSPEPNRADFDRSADEALRAAAARLGSPEAAGSFLAARAQAGVLAIIATHYVVDRPGYFDTLHEHELGDEFLSRCDWAAGDWRIGDFEAHIGRHVTLKACGVRFKQLEVEAALRTVPVGNAVAKRGRGRRRGIGGYESKDQPLIEKMHRLITECEASSPYAAATMVVGEAAGNGTDDAKRQRLVARYRKAHGEHRV